MSFFTHTANWIRGEMLDSSLIAGVGLLTMGIAFACWWFGETAAAKAVLIPFLLVGATLAASGVAGYGSNQKRFVEFEQTFLEDPAAFVLAEKERVESFQYLYKITLVGAAVCFT